ncbi:MAG: hypothetical protein RLZZ426_132 [Actinomycetota bacterium]
MDFESMAKPKKPLISIVVPVFNEVDNITIFHQRVSAAISKISAYEFEFVFTDNHSTDGTYEVLTAVAVSDPRVRVFRFSRNFGFQRSIWTGYTKARGAAAIQLDVDLQDPPELIADFIAHWESGYKVVYGIRRSRQEGRAITGSRKLFYRFVNLLSEDPIPVDAGDFRLVDRMILDELIAMPDTQPYLRGTIAALGFEQIGIPYDRAARERGVSKFSFKDLIALSFDAILNHSTIPLRIASYVGLFVAGATLLGTLILLIARWLFGAEWPAGFATTTMLILFSISLNAVFLGIIGEYLGRIYKQIKPRSITVIEKSIDNT